MIIMFRVSLYGPLMVCSGFFVCRGFHKVVPTFPGGGGWPGFSEFSYYFRPQNGT
jgi:hypothetical protein